MDDLFIGLKIGRLMLIEKEKVLTSNNKYRTYWKCKCDCGNIKLIRSDILKSGKQISCGCFNKEKNLFKSNDIKNKRFGKLIVLESTDKRDKNNGSVIWKCRCDCGNIAYYPEYFLKNKRVISCGCEREKLRIKHGEIIGNLTKQYCIDNTNVRNLTMKISKKNTSGVKGVCWDSNRQKWIAQIRFKNKNYHLGRYLNKEDAIKARQIGEEKLFNNFLDWYYNEKVRKEVKNEKV